MDYFVEYGYLGLFLSAFLAATVLPLSSEVVLSALLLSDLSVSRLVIVATVGNVLGSCVNYAFGYWSSFGLIKKVLRVSEQSLVNARQRFEKFGLWSLCFAWVPIIGDPLTLIAGVLRVPLAWFLLLVTIGKLARYLAVCYFFQI